ncbi:hypothetical protein NE237_006767 [Protea cynaroides]|uniref:Uncharacterized protein n=1 Tax=Protea cynaroides TaxID=273540 RepID=A0A9Q0KMW3_9MAGN|nr:hypothetical protein NE237_006767 [Protea cynaroides]
MYVVESEGGAIACMMVSLLLLGTFPAIFTLLERRGRLPHHTYLDYSIANLFIALIIPLTLGQIGKLVVYVLFAMAGGVVLSLGNIAQQYAFALVGLSVMMVISSSMIVLIGATLYYFLDNRINNAKILFPGVACFFIAICLGSALHLSNEADNKAKLTGFSNSNRGGTGTIDTPGNGLETSPDNGKEFFSLTICFEISHPKKAKIGTADFLMGLENKRAIRLWALLAGLLCGLANCFQFMGGQAAGYATVDSV